MIYWSMRNPDRFNSTSTVLKTETGGDFTTIRGSKIGGEKNKT